MTLQTLRNTGIVLGLLAGLTATAGLTAARAEIAGSPLVAESSYDMMNGAPRKMPSFAPLTKKPGYLRGFVKDAAGKPVVGAKVLVSSSAFGGFRSGATGVTDARGYYEVKAPYGMACAYCAGYGTMYDGTYLSLPLHAADGLIDDFVSKEGHVENFVVLTWGMVDEAKVSQDPVYSGNYYGASFTLGYFLKEEDDNTAPASNLPLNSTLEVTLTPDGPLADGSAGRQIVARQKLDWSHSNYTQFNDIPIGRYKILARLVLPNGKTEVLRIRDKNNDPRKGGLTPKEAIGEATVLFRSNAGDPGVIRIPGGNMERLSLLVDRVEGDAK